MVELEIKNLNLNGGKSEINFYPEERMHTHYTYFLKHMLSQLFTHGRIGGDVEVHVDNGKNLWGEVGKKVSEEIGPLLRSRRNQYGWGSSIISSYLA